MIRKSFLLFELDLNSERIEEMQRLAQILPASALRFSRSYFTCPRPNLHAPACSTVWQRNVRFLSSTTEHEELHPVMKPVDDAAAKPLKYAEDRWLERSKKALEEVQSRPPADPYAGRSVSNNSERQVANSLRHLEAILARNKVRQQLRLTERHEKKGVKRRRLSSERWRKRFADEVRKKVQLVMKIRDRGA
ncbi:hypothetical protein CPB84DRAFT_1776621 [Gymnopilus junonius]|uniref:Ribosomal protein S21 n=1 Tax=Gymnopilus junonius TaxID=109634 RepID=A0A9P5TP42_GYMJU|nr:hypothetical protein CPB84DRAFT_1776621 [Gymnopilus junonius]